MRYRGCAWVLAALLTSAAAYADLIPRGWRSVDHAVIIEGAERWPEYELYLYPIGPTHRGIKALEIDAAKGHISTSFYRACEPFLFAFPKGGAWPGNLHIESFTRGSLDPKGEIHRSDARLRLPATVRVGSPVQRIESRYVIEDIGGGRITLRHEVRELTRARMEAAKIRDERARRLAALQARRDELLRRPPVFLGLSLVGLIGILWLRRQRSVEG